MANAPQGVKDSPLSAPMRIEAAENKQKCANAKGIIKIESKAAAAPGNRHEAARQERVQVEQDLTKNKKIDMHNSHALGIGSLECPLNPLVLNTFLDVFSDRDSRNCICISTGFPFTTARACNC